MYTHAYTSLKGVNYHLQAQFLAMDSQQDIDARDDILNSTGSDSNEDDSRSATPPPKRSRRSPVVKHRKIIRRPNSSSILKELKRTNNTIITLSERLRKAEKRMRKMDKEIKSSDHVVSSDRAAGGCTRKRKVPNGVRVSIYYVAIAIYS